MVSSIRWNPWFARARAQHTYLPPFVRKVDVFGGNKPNSMDSFFGVYNCLVSFAVWSKSFFAAFRFCQPHMPFPSFVHCTWQINLRFEHPILKFCRIICFFKSRPYPTNFFEAVLPSTLSALILIQQLFQIAQGRFLLTLVHLTMTMSFSRATHADVYDVFFRIRPEIEHLQRKNACRSAYL